MNRAFLDAYEGLNAAQRLAVDTLEGPVLVIAGPGTGKTQLLSARVANILSKTDTPAGNILCLTFTESGAANMRDRLTRFIGQTAYDVTIGTYHAFGGDLIQRYPEYFNETRLQSPIDDLTKRQVMMAIVETLSFDDPLKQSRHHIGDLMSSISEIKRALLTSQQLHAIAAENLEFIQQANASVSEIFAGFKSMPGYRKAAPLFEQVLALLQQLDIGASAAGSFSSIAGLASSELHTALQEAEAAGKTTPLTVWKNNWLAKDADNQFVMAGELENRRLVSLGSVLDKYQSALAARGLYDFDDMIIRAIEVLENNPDLKYTLQEKYLYILLDEFQDTNAAQLKLMQLLTDNPISEGRPNVLAVGDDDQAIYAFQGAQYSNMLDFLQTYRDVTTINLTENYRSHKDILETSRSIATQIEGRLENHFPEISKTLTAANASLQQATIERVSFQSPIAERDWVARRIKKLVDAGTSPSEIAVLAPKHKYLEPLVPYLNNQDIPVRYEKRENILQAAIVKQLTVMSRLVIALSESDEAMADALWPQVLSHDCWDIPVDKIWQASWKVRGKEAGAVHWSDVLLIDEAFRRPALFFLAAAAKSSAETLETMLDYLAGTIPIETHTADMPTISSPLRDYCCSPAMQQEHPELFLDTVSHLAVLRAKLMEYQNASDTTLNIADFIGFINLYEDAEQQIINTSPHSQQDDAVQFMTVFKAKGLEYQHVFLVHCENEVWGSGARGNSNKLTLPANLKPIRYGGANDDERLRVLFVAITRAKTGLYLTNSLQQYSGKRSTRLKYFDEQEQSDNTFAAMVLPPDSRIVRQDDSEVPSLELMQLDWHTKHIASLKDISLRSLLAERLESYQISPTHVISFLDLEYQGPQRFFLQTILNLPEAPTADGQFGTAIHETLEWVQHRVSETGFLPVQDEILAYCHQRIAAKRLTAERTVLEIQRADTVLPGWLKERQKIFAVPAIVERSFKHEGVRIGKAHLAGRIDRMEVNEKSKTITVVDYKTGKSYKSWKPTDTKLFKNELQLYLYKVLIEHSRTYKDYQVRSGRLEFIEPDDFGRINTLEVQFTSEGTARAEALVQAVWSHVQALDFPATDTYGDTLSGMRQFAEELISSTTSSS